MAVFFTFDITWETKSERSWIVRIHEPSNTVESLPDLAEALSTVEGEAERNLVFNLCIGTGGPLKSDFGLSGNVHIPQLSHSDRGRLH
jgi:hypothetical protein